MGKGLGVKVARASFEFTLKAADGGLACCEQTEIGRSSCDRVTRTKLPTRLDTSFRPLARLRTGRQTRGGCGARGTTHFRVLACSLPYQKHCKPGAVGSTDSAAADDAVQRRALGCCIHTRSPRLAPTKLAYWRA